MKRITLLVGALLLGMSVYAQKGEKSVGLNLSYGTEIENLGIGVNGQYTFLKNWRADASFNYFLKKNGLSMWDINLNGHYLIPLGDKFKVYPLAGVVYSRWKLDSVLGDISSGKFGVNLGGGVQYDLNQKLALKGEVKYQLINTYDQANFTVGLAYKF